MPNLIRLNEQQNRIKQYEFNEELLKEISQPIEEEEPSNPSNIEDKKEEKKVLENEKKIQENKKNEEKDYDIIGQRIIDDARRQAEEILKNAKTAAQQMKEEAFEAGHKEGYDAGINEGKEQAYKEIKDLEEQKTIEYLNELQQVINDVSIEKERILSNYKSNLIDIAVSVAEKVIQVSLKTSGEIIERMILSATERLASKEWVKIYISKTDAELMIEGGIDILHALSNLSDNIKVIPMENEGQGTCIIEFPDEIIDASANTQVENIRDIISNSAV